ISAIPLPLLSFGALPCDMRQRRLSNESSRGDFFLVGFSDWPQLEPVLFGIVLTSYLLTMLGNTAIIVVSRLDPRLHTPMYYFLGHLSFLDLCYATSITPGLLANLRGQAQTIGHLGCMVQLCVSLALGCTECFLLAVMAYDRYAAVCRPLRYAALVPPALCRALAAVSWLGGAFSSLVQAGLVGALPLCGLRRLDHFLCEMPALLRLTCERNPGGTEAKMFVTRVLVLLVPVSLILVSYGHIARTVLRMRSAGGRRKAAGTCGCHLTAVTLFYGSAISVYLQPVHRYSQGRGKFVTLFYTVVTPTLNPLIYSLRNQDVKRALGRLLKGQEARGL
uniref:Olfactory receptor n=1 Tax=Ornithorhynchus anatinus TaxID=9258 RepID=F6VLC6_ORNAN